MFVSAQLLELVENQAIRKFVVRDEDGGDGAAAIIVGHGLVTLSDASRSHSSSSSGSLRRIFATLHWHSPVIHSEQ